MSKIELIVTLYNSVDEIEEEIEVIVKIDGDTSYHSPDVPHLTDRAKNILGRILSEDANLVIMAVNDQGSSGNI